MLLYIIFEKKGLIIFDTFLEKVEFLKFVDNSYRITEML